MKKPYKTTATAGQFIAGERIPSETVDGVRRPKVGHVLHLTDAQAKYELLQGSIEPAEVAKAKAPGEKPKA